MANYYVKNGGNDGADGLSDGNAWATISKVNGFSFASGDTISFKCGSYWRETLTIPRSGTSEGYMIFNSYSTGDKPKILGSNTTTWTAEGHTNIWQSDSSLSDPYNISGYYESEIFYRETGGTINWSDAKKTYTSDFSNLVNEYDWTCNANTIYVYAESDPDSRYASVEVPQRNFSINIGNHEYITIDNFEIAYAGNHNITTEYPQENTYGLTIKNCYVHHVGSPFLADDSGNNFNVMRSDLLIQNNDISHGGRRNLSLHIYGSDGITIRNITIEGNYFHHGFHSMGVSMALGGPEDNNIIENVIIRKNITYQPYINMGIEDGSEMCTVRAQKYESPGNGIHNVEIYNNIFIYCDGAEVWHEGVDNSKIYNNTFYDFGYRNYNGNLFHIQIGRDCSGIDIMNNIFYGTTDFDENAFTLNIYIEEASYASEVTIDYNLFYNADTYAGCIQVGSDKYRTSGGTKNMDDIYLDYGYQEHGSYLFDPLFISETDYHLQPGSPAIGAGIDIPGYTIDFDGNPVSSPPSLGAYEFGSSSCPVITNMNPMIHSIHVNS